MAYFKFFKQCYSDDEIDRIGENDVYQDFVHEWDRETAVTFIYKLKCNEKVETKEALYWSEEI